MTKKLAYLENFSYLCRVIRRYGEGRIIEASADDATLRKIHTLLWKKTS